MAESPRLILASQSPRRAELLSRLGLDFEIVPAEIDESYRGDEMPAGHAERLAREKAVSVARANPDALVIGSDTIVLIDDDVAWSSVMKPAPTPPTVQVLPASEHTEGHWNVWGLAPLKRLPSVIPFSRAATSPNGLKEDPGFRRPWTARSNWENSKGRPEAITFTAPVQLSTIVIAPVGTQEWVSAYRAR